MMTRRILSCLVHLTLFGSIADGAPLRIDLNPDNGRKDVMTVGWQNWQIKEAPSVTQSFGGVNVTLMDGSTRFVNSNVNLATWRALGTRAGGEVAGEY